MTFQRDRQSYEGEFKHQLNRVSPFKHQMFSLFCLLFNPGFLFVGRPHSQLQTYPLCLLPNSFISKHARKILSVINNITINVCTLTG